MKITLSRNKREGRYIAGWCGNPHMGGYKKDRDQPVRAGANNSLAVIFRLGKTYILVPRVQA